MEIILNNVWKRYNAGWVIKELSDTIKPNEKIALTGTNGSGKSTLLSIVAGVLPQSKGSIEYAHNGRLIPGDKIYRYTSIAAAYAELDEELSISEIWNYYRNFKPFSIRDFDEFIDFSGFAGLTHKPLNQFSSGMKQRLMLALALNYDVPLLLLDEPGSYLDRERKDWFAAAFAKMAGNKTVLIASNDAEDLALCSRSITL